jgi:hypothetical protein
MLALWTLCLLAGYVLAARFHYFVLFPATIFMLLLTGLASAKGEGDLWLMSRWAAINVTTLQAAYLFGKIILPFSEVCRFFVEHRPRFPDNNPRP